MSIQKHGTSNIVCHYIARCHISTLLLSVIIEIIAPFTLFKSITELKLGKMQWEGNGLHMLITHGSAAFVMFNSFTKEFNQVSELN